MPSLSALAAVSAGLGMTISALIKTVESRIAVDVEQTGSGDETDWRR